MNLTQEQFEGFAKQLQEFTQRASDIAEEYSNITGEYFDRKEATIAIWGNENWLDSPSIVFKWEEYYGAGSGSPEHFTFDLPTWCLYTENWQEKVRAEVVRKREEEARVVKAKREREQAQAESKERAELARLQAKYGTSTGGFSCK